MNDKMALTKAVNAILSEIKEVYEKEIEIIKICEFAKRES